MLLDTHVLVWLHEGLDDRFSAAARALLESEPLHVSPPSLLELDYLHEVGRIGGGSEVVLAHLQPAIGLEVLDVGSQSLFRAAAVLTWTRDPFDRLIAAHSALLGAALLTRDRLLLERLPTATWP